MSDEWIAPSITGGLLVIAGTVAAIANIRNTRTGAVERRAPSAAEAWAETDRARARMYAFEDRFWTVLGALKHLVRAIKQRHPDFPITEDVAEALTLTAPEETEKEKTS